MNNFRVMRVNKRDNKERQLGKYGRTVRRIQGRQCAVCGIKYELQTHHIIHRKTHPGLSFVMNNGIVLCWDHHEEAHYGRFVRRKSYPIEEHVILPFSYQFD